MRVLCIDTMFISLCTKFSEIEPSRYHKEKKRKHAVRRFRRTAYTEVLSWTCDGVQHLTVPFFVTPVAQAMQCSLLLSIEGRTRRYDRFLSSDSRPLLNYRCSPHSSTVQRVRGAVAIPKDTLSNALDFSSESNTHINDIVHEKVMYAANIVWTSRDW